MIKQKSIQLEIIPGVKGGGKIGLNKYFECHLTI